MGIVVVSAIVALLVYKLKTRQSSSVVGMVRPETTEYETSDSLERNKETTIPLGGRLATD